MIYRLVPLLVFFIFFDLEANVWTLASGFGERITLATTGGIGEYNVLKIEIKMSDLCFLFLWILFFGNLMYGRFSLKDLKLSKYGFLLLFVTIGLFSLWENSNNYTEYQITVAFLYTARLLEVSLIFAIAIGYLKLGYDLSRLAWAIVFGVLVAGLIGTLGFVEPAFGKMFVPDRVTFYGPILLGSFFLVYLLSSPDLTERIGISRKLIFLALTFSLVGVAFSGKRVVVFGFLGGIIWMIRPIVRGKQLFLGLLLLVAISGGIFVFYQKTFFASSGAEVGGYVGEVWSGIDENFSEAILSRQQGSSSFILDNVKNIDTSIRSRIGRVYRVLDILEGRMMTGVGLMAAPFVHISPDNFFSHVMLESGLLGLLVIIIYFVILWHWCISNVAHKEADLINGLFTAFMFMGVGANVIYTSPLFATFLLLCVIAVYLREGEEGLEFTPDLEVQGSRGIGVWAPE